jgi:hypothetical protein
LCVSIVSVRFTAGEASDRSQLRVNDKI